MDVEVVQSLEDVQRFYMLLEPKRAGAKSRLLIVGKKRLPDVNTHEARLGRGGVVVRRGWRPGSLTTACTAT